MYVNEKNLKEFQDWLLNLKPRSDMSAYDMAKNLYFDLPLSVILNKAPTLSPIAQEVIANVIARGYGDKNHAADAETLLDLAEMQPILLGKTYDLSGNSRSGTMYSLLMDTIKKRPFEKNIPAIYTILHFAPVYSRDVGTGDIGKTSAKNAKMLNEIFENSDSRSLSNKFRNSAYEFIYGLDMNKLLNFEGASPEFRARINAATFNNRNNDKYDLIAKINPELIDEQILANFINTPKPKKKDTTDAKTQAEKNANILPASYTKPRDALIRMVERQEIHDHNNYGKLKTLTQRFKDLKARMQKAKTWPENNPNYETLAKDVYLKMIQRDIIDGRAADLSKEELELAFRADKDGFYLRKIPDDVRNGIPSQNNAQNNIGLARHADQAEYVVTRTKASSRDKRAVIEKLEQDVMADAPMRKQLDAELTAYDRDHKEVESTGMNAKNTYTVYTDLSHIQAAYKRIRDNFKDGTPNAAEAHLTPAEMERAIYGYITGASDRTIDMPTQKSLPIFGRGTEKDRRERLEREIRDFNEIMANVRRHMTDELIAILAEYRGAILNPDSLNRANGEQNDATKAANAKYAEFKNTHRDRATIEFAQKQYASKKESLDRAKAGFETQQKKMRERSRRHMGRNQSGELTPVTDDMTPEEKRRVREKNRRTLNDPLAARKNKKPAKNLAEMLANAEMER